MQYTCMNRPCNIHVNDYIHQLTVPTYIGMYTVETHIYHPHNYIYMYIYKKT